MQIYKIQKVTLKLISLLFDDSHSWSDKGITHIRNNLLRLLPWQQNHTSLIELVMCYVPSICPQQLSKQ